MWSKRLVAGLLLLEFCADFAQGDLLEGAAADDEDALTVRLEHLLLDQVADDLDDGLPARVWAVEAGVAQRDIGVGPMVVSLEGNKEQLGGFLPLEHGSSCDRWVDLSYATSATT